jgi:hypothetical protein
LIGEFPLSVFPVLTNEADGIEFLEAVPGEPDRWQYGLYRSERSRPRGESLSVLGFACSRAFGAN